MKIPRGWSSLLPPSSHCQKRTHLGFRGDTALRGQWRMPRRLFCRRFYFVSVKERKVKQSQSGRLATPGGFFCQAVETLGDRGPKQARRFVAKKEELEGPIHPHPSLLPTKSFSPAKMSHRPIFPNSTCSKLKVFPPKERTQEDKATKGRECKFHKPQYPPLQLKGSFEFLCLLFASQPWLFSKALRFTKIGKEPTRPPPLNICKYGRRSPSQKQQTCIFKLKIYLRQSLDKTSQVVLFRCAPFSPSV